MADEWIKMRRNLMNHPKVVRMMSALDADTFRTVGGLHAVWSVFDEFSEDGKLNGYSCTAMDRVIHWPGFSAAMVLVGWLVEEDNSLTIPEFMSHNGSSGKRRSQEAKRKHDVRKVSASDADKSRTKSGLEEEVEEEEYIRAKALTPLPPLGMRSKVKPMPEGFGDFWNAYPRRIGQVAAVKAFAKLTPSEVAIVMEAVPKHARRWKILGTEPQFIPHPSTWLNQGRWKDDLGTDQAQRPTQPQSRQASIAEVLIRGLTDVQQPQPQSRLALPGSHHGVLDAYAEQLSSAARSGHDPRDSFGLGEDLGEEPFE